MPFLLQVVLQLPPLALVAALLALSLLLVVIGQSLLRSLRQRGKLVPLRKYALAAAFLLLGVAFLFGEPLAHWLADLAYGVHGGAAGLNASGALIEADAKVGGWVPVGTATSKIILAISFYVLSYLVPWVVQQVTHPAPTAWTKAHYTDEFTALPTADKFQLVSRLSQNQSLRIAAAMLTAALIQ